jgi:hypothetical protein
MEVYRLDILGLSEVGLILKKEPKWIHPSIFWKNWRKF